MQDKQTTNTQQNYPQALSPRELQRIADLKELWQGRCNPSPDEIEQLILTLPGKFRELAVQAVAEQFILSIKLHLLQLAATFCNQVQKEGYEGYYESEPDETLHDNEASFHEIFTLNQRLNIDSVEKLFKLGTVAVNVMGLCHSETTDVTESSLYTIPALYQGWLEKMSLLKDK